MSTYSAMYELIGRTVVSKSGLVGLLTGIDPEAAVGIIFPMVNGKFDDANIEIISLVLLSKYTAPVPKPTSVTNLVVVPILTETKSPKVEPLQHLRPRMLMCCRHERYCTDGVDLVGPCWRPARHICSSCKAKVCNKHFTGDNPVFTDWCDCVKAVTFLS